MVLKTGFILARFTIISLQKLVQILIWILFSWCKMGNLVYLQIFFYRTNVYGRYSVIINEIHLQNRLQSCHHNIIFYQLRTNKWNRYLLHIFKIDIKTNFSVVYARCQFIKLPLIIDKFIFHKRKICYETCLGLLPPFLFCSQKLSSVITRIYNLSLTFLWWDKTNMK